jgi:cytochrome c oxidase cbb3-type subunit III
MPARAITCFAGACFMVIILGSCQQREPAAALPYAGAVVGGNRQSELQPGVVVPVRPVRNPLEGDEAALADGKRLYNYFNCSGCHAAAGARSGRR